jgi:thioredoxin-dependent peroxiredoxin
VSFDTPEENKAFAEKQGFGFPLVCDTSREIGMAYGATDTLHAGNAKRIGVVVGPDGRVKEWLPKVDPRTYPREVLARI